MRRRMGRGLVWMFAGGWVEQGLNFAAFVALARLLGPETFGLMAAASAPVVLAEGLVRETLTEPLIARRDPAPGHFDAVFRLLALLSGAIALGLAAASPALAAFQGRPDAAAAFAVLALSVLVTGLAGVPVAVLRRGMRFEALAIRAVAGAAAGGVAGVAAALAGWGLWALVVQRLVLLLVDAALVWAWAGWRPGRAPSGREIREVSGMGAQVFAFTAANLAAQQAPALIIGPLLGPAALGRFAIAWRLVETAAALIATPLRFVAQSAFARLRQGGDGAEAAAGVRALMGDAAEVAGLAALAGFGGLALLAGPVIALLFGPGWEEAGPVLAILCLTGGFLCLERVQTAFCLAAGRAGGLALLALAETAAGIAAMLLAAPLGLPAVAAAFALRSWMLWPLRFRLAAGLGAPGLGETLRRLAPLLPAAVLMAAAVLVWRAGKPFGESPAIVVAGGALLGGAAFAGWLALVVPDRLGRALRLVTGR